MLIQGATISFDEYRTKALRKRKTPIIWKWIKMSEMLKSAKHHPRGSLVLSSSDENDPATIAPGLSFTIQVIKPGENTQYHQHSFWHLYIVNSGQGFVSLENENIKHELTTGDALFIPAWYSHQFANETNLSFILFAIQNLPQQAALGSLIREENNSNEKKVIYSN